MKTIVIGMGVQGNKRKKFLGKNFVASVDKYKKAKYRNIKEVPLSIYDSAYICTPDDQKKSLIRYLIDNKKNILVEKPFIGLEKNLKMINKIIKKNKSFFYTAYNHRFEPSLIKLQKIIKNKQLGKIYYFKIFYGNGTSYLVKKSLWRDQKQGIISDLGSHLIDMCLYLFNKPIDKIKILSSNKFENKSPDYALISLKIGKILVVLEMTYTMWKNSFFLDVIGSKGSAHIHSLCKWSKSSLSLRKRKFPSGLPKEKKFFFKKGDPTWKLENDFVKKNLKNKKFFNIDKDIKINKLLQKI